MRRGVQKAMMALVAAAISGMLFYSCTQNTIPDFGDVASCVGCHTNYAHLNEVYTPDTTAPVGGCGGDAPHYEPYDRVYLDGSGYEAFKKSSHGSLACTSCHGGTDGTHEKEIAHSGDFIKHPSMQYNEKCGGCHFEISENFKSSLHNGTGQKRKVTIRSGLKGAHEFDQLPAHQIEGYNANCSHCHGTCGNCHVNRPAAAGGGLANGHNFVSEVSMLNTCVKCHSSRGGHAFLGEAPGTSPDLHLADYGMKCMDCHKGHELHGNGDTTVVQRYQYSELPKCEDCHENIEDSNNYHSKHIGDFNCQVCHSQDYNNCGSCHIHGDGARYPSYLDFKIAMNPLPDVKPGFKMALVRRTLAAPDNWEVYGVESYSNFDAFPTYNFTTPHNILKKTTRTDVGENEHCASKCHIRTEADTVYNRQLYLFESDLLEWEINATKDITVDGKLPAGWFN